MTAGALSVLWLTDGVDYQLYLVGRELTLLGGVAYLPQAVEQSRTPVNPQVEFLVSACRGNVGAITHCQFPSSVTTDLEFVCH